MVNELKPGTKEIATALREATKGLRYMSESDEPFEVVTWPGDDKPLDAKKLLARAGQKPGTAVQVAELDGFFGDLIVEQDWFGAEERADARRYRQLLELLKTHLAVVKVFRIGKINVAIYILGRTRDGDWAGVRTLAVET